MHRLRVEGPFDADPIRIRWREHLSGEHGWSHHLWAVLMFQAWHEAQDAAQPIRSHGRR